VADIVGSAVIEVTADARKLRAGIDEAKRAIRTLPEGQKDITAGASRSIDNYIGKLQAQNLLLGKSGREAELFKLALRGASIEQINAANAALLVKERYEKVAVAAAAVRTGLFLIAGAAATAAAAFAAAANRNIDFVDHLRDLSKSTSISVEDLAGLSLLARQSGTDIDTLAKTINRLTVEIGKAPEEFEELGVTAKDGVGALKQMADIFAALPDVTQRNLLAQKAFSRSWQEIAPILAEGGNRIGEIVEKGKKLSGITTEIAERADQFKDRLEELKLQGSALGLTLLPSLNNIAAAMLKAKEEGDSFFGALVEGARQATQEVLRLNNVGDLNRVSRQIANLANEILRNEELQRRGATGLEPYLKSLRAQLPELQKKRDILEGVGKLETDAAKQADQRAKAEKAANTADKERQEAVRRFNQDRDTQTQTLRQILAAREDFAEKAIALEVAATQARLASTANLVSTQQELERAELSAITRRVAAQRAAGEAEMVIAKARSKTSEEATQGQLAAGRKMYDALVAADINYLNIVKKNRERIVAIDQELADSRKKTADFIRSVDEEGFTDEQKRQSLFRQGVENESKLRDAAISGDINKRREFAAEALKIAEAFKGFGEGGVGARFAEDAQRLNELGLSVEKLAAQTAGRAAESASQTLEKQIAGIETRLTELQAKGLSDFHLKINEDSLKGVVESVKNALGSQPFKIEVQALVTPIVRNGSSFSDVGSTPNSRMSQFADDLAVSQSATIP